MAEVMKIQGVRKVVHNVNSAKAGAAYGVEVGLKKAGLFLQGKSQDLAPVDTGNLHGGAYTRHEGTGVDTEVEVGYVAEYAVYVHEDLFAHHNVGQAKFLEQPMRDHKDDVTRIVQDEVKRHIKP